MTGIKICGITRKEDITSLNNYLPDYMGFVFAESRRKVTPEKAFELAFELNPVIKRVGVFVNEQIGSIVKIAEFVGLNAVQIHGDETAEEIKSLKQKLGERVQVWKAIRVKNAESLTDINKYGSDRIVLDSYSPDAYGGNGTAFDWRDACGLEGMRMVLAGGLKADNVNEAIRLLRPGIVDVSSGVETNGLKDPGKIRDFVYTVRSREY